MLDVLRTPPVVDLDPYEVATLRSPYDFQAALRDAGAVVELSPYGVYATGRHEEAKIVLSDYERFTASGGVGIQDIRNPGDHRIPSRLLETDPPEHTRNRSAAQKVLSPLVFRRWREQANVVAEEIVQDALRQGEINGIDDLVEKFILRVFPMIVGVQLPREETLAIGEMRFNQSGPRNELHVRALSRAQPYLAWFDQSCSRESVLPGSIADELFSVEDRGDLDKGVATNIVRSFVGGGTDSTISGLGTAVHHLARDPEQWALLKAKPAKAKTALDEATRIEAPFQVTYRTTTREIDLAGLHLRAGTKIGVFLGAANRDPRKWVDPDRFDLNRQIAGIHLGFGTAAHVCIGQMLARLEAECLLTELAKSVSTIELVGTPAFRPINQMRMLDTLPLRLAA